MANQLRGKLARVRLAMQPCRALGKFAQAPSERASMSDYEIELYKAHRSSQEKYVYFMLAASGACIAFSLTRSQSIPLEARHIFLGLAVLSWAASFWCGCRHLMYVSATLYNNIELLKIERGSHRLVGQHPFLIQAASAGARDGLEIAGDKSAANLKLQFYYIIIGAAFYIIWHVTEMYYA